MNLSFALRLANIDWTRGADEIAAVVRSGAQAALDGRVVQVLSVRTGGIRSPYAPGTIVRCDDEVWVQAGVGHVVLERVRDEQARDVAAAQFLAARGIGVGQRFDALPPTTGVVVAA